MTLPMTVAALGVELVSIAECPAIFPIYNGETRQWTVTIHDVVNDDGDFGLGVGDSMLTAIVAALAEFRLIVARRNDRSVAAAMEVR